jgi:hypothetical protein
MSKRISRADEQFAANEFAAPDIVSSAGGIDEIPRLPTRTDQ